MKPVIDLLVCLRRHELTARSAHNQMSPCEKTALEAQTALVRGTLPEYVLTHYDHLKRGKRAAEACPVLLAMATLVRAYRALPARRRRALTSFFDLARYSPRNS